MMARIAPGGFTVRPFLHRLRGVVIHDRVFIGDDAYLENEYPENVEIHADATISIRVLILAHTLGRGKVIIEKAAFIGPGAMILCRSSNLLRIGEGAVVAAGSIVSRSVPPRTLCSGPRGELIAEVTVPLTPYINYNKFVFGLRPLKKPPS